MAKVSKAQLEQERKSSPVLDYMIKNNIPLTRKNYLNLAYMGNPPQLGGRTAAPENGSSTEENVV